MRNFTPEELGHPLASWIRRPPDPPDTALLAGLDAPMDPAPPAGRRAPAGRDRVVCTA